MKEAVPPKVALQDRVMGPWALLRRGSRNIVSTIPAGLLAKPVMTGRMIWKWVSVSGPDEAAHVLARNGANYPRSPVVRAMLSPAVRHSLFLADDTACQWERRVIRPQYSAKRCLGYVAVFREAAALQAACLADTRNLRFDALDHVTNITLSGIVRTACAAEDLLDPDTLRRAFVEYIDKTARVSVSDMLRLPAWLSAALKRPSGRILDHLRNQIDGLVENRATGRTPRRDDLLQALIESRDPQTGQPMAPCKVRDNLLLMVLAGHETTANSLAWAIHLLATHPEAQARARAEALALEGLPAQDLAAASPYLTAVLEETMRLYPALPLLLRQAREADEVSGCPVTRGSFVFVPLYAMHRHRAHWQAPDAFRPERFLDKDVPRRAYLPFSAGARSCLGANFAMLEMRVVLADFLTRFRFAATPGRTPKPTAVLSLRPAGGVWIDAERV